VGGVSRLGGSNPPLSARLKVLSLNQVNKMIELKGEMAERLKALDSKSSRQTKICLEGSNPSLSASESNEEGKFS
jgi:hypothetical protein